MAEIQFERKGTPVWLVVLILAVVATAAYFLLARRPEPAAQTATATDSTTATAVAPAAPAAPLGPSAEYVKFATERRFPKDDAAAQRPFLSDVARHLSSVLQERAPTQGVQILLLKSIADTIAMPDTKASRLPDLTQLAFFVFANAYKAGAQGNSSLVDFAGRIQPNVPVGTQARDIQAYLDAARDQLRPGGVKRDSTLPAPPATPAAPAATTPPAPAGRS